MFALDRDAAARNLRDVLSVPAARTDALSQDDFSTDTPEHPEWAIGPFARDESMTYRAERVVSDPLQIGWQPTSLINPSLATGGDGLVMAYRASPKKESLSSRIGIAAMGRDGTWTDHGIVIYPTADNELYGCEDPKLYRHDGRWFLFYNGIFPVDPADRLRYPSPGFPVGEVGCDINLAISDDLITWHKIGPIVSHEVSRLWAKGAAIVRDPYGVPVRLGRRGFRMFLSEGCNGRMLVGHSSDMIHWSVESHRYLDLTSIRGHLHEVACATTGHSGRDLILDFLYSEPDGRFAAGQALYDAANPTVQKALSRGGTLAWGGLLAYDGRWLMAQGWDAPAGCPELYLYRGPELADDVRRDRIRG